MSNNFSSVVRAGRDAEVRTIPSGTQIMNVTCASTTGYGDRQSTLWLRVNYWGKGGAAVAPYILKGTQFFVTGELSMNTYTDSSGVEKQNLELNVNSIDLIGNRNDAQPSPQSAPQQQAPEGQPFDDELPF